MHAYKQLLSTHIKSWLETDAHRGSYLAHTHDVLTRSYKLALMVLGSFFSISVRWGLITLKMRFMSFEAQELTFIELILLRHKYIKWH